jgi:hypothetical protein
MKTHDSKKGTLGADIKGKAGSVASRHLFEAIDLVRTDVAKVEFWANAVEQFSQPIPDYDPKDATVWIPPESGVTLKGQSSKNPKDQSGQSSSGESPSGQRSKGPAQAPKQSGGASKRRRR